MTTVALSPENRDVLKHWARAKGYSSIDKLITAWREAVRLKKAQELYRSLPTLALRAKPLRNRKVRRNYR